MLTVYCWLLCLYPRSYRHEFGDEMASVFHDARIELPSALVARISFYLREFCGLLSGALRAHSYDLFGPAIPFPRFCMKRQFRFPRSTVFLMCVILAGVVVAINKAVDIVEQKKGLPLGSSAAWEPMLGALLLMLALLFAVVITVWAVLFATGRTGMHRLANVQTRPEQQ
jgi:hypothetical protein